MAIVPFWLLFALTYNKTTVYIIFNRIEGGTFLVLNGRT